MEKLNSLSENTLLLSGGGARIKPRHSGSDTQTLTAITVALSSLLLAHVIADKVISNSFHALSTEREKKYYRPLKALHIEF